MPNKHKLSLWDRLRGWHWRSNAQFLIDGSYLGTIWTKHYNWCGCKVGK